MAVQIPLTRGKFAIVDDEDAERVNQFAWFYMKNGYAARQGERDGDKRTLIHLHRVIMNAPADMQVDHINGDTLDNRKANLRICTHAENIINRPGRPGASKYKGVTLDNRRGRWYARLSAQHIGSFATEEEAARAYDEFAKDKYGEFAWLNFPDDDQFDRQLYRQALQVEAPRTAPRKARIGRKRRAKRVEVECAYCGASMIRTEYNATRHERNFCSRSCASSFYNLRRERKNDGSFASTE